MKITKEQFDTLPQNDRIEFRQVEDRIIERTESNNTQFVVWYSVVLISFILVISLLIKSSFGGDNYLIILNKIPLISTFLVAYLFLGFFLDAYNILKRRKEIEILENKFFKLIKKKGL